jgi:radical SAM superfamily enzyme YgiQ (UPF0313 family)
MTENSKNMRILLNCLPPVDLNTPSISLSVLQSFMKDKGVETKVKYWNFQLSLMQEHSDSEDTEIRLLPFLSILNDLAGDDKSNQRINSFFQSQIPEYISSGQGYYLDLLNEMKDEIHEIIENDLSEIDFSDILIFGISAKYYQWIPGIILAKKVKEIAPHVKVVVGGFGNANVAQEAMNLCSEFDIATWGEGEYPLLHLYNALLQEDVLLSEVPRLLYRNESELKQSDSKKSDYLDMENFNSPDYNDFYNTIPEDQDKDDINIPLSSIRSCHWGKCKFCDFNHGYKLRMRSPESIINEIVEISSKFEVYTYSFVDSDTFGNIDHFNKLLDLLIDLKLKTQWDLSFWSEIIPNPHFDKDIVDKMAIAGFKNIFIGYDGLSDSMLKGMNKRNSFADNLNLVKLSIAQGINPYVNVIRFLPHESEEEIQECIQNLHFTRFFYHDSVVEFKHNFVDLVMSSMSKYYRELDTQEKDEYCVDIITHLCPSLQSEGNERFHLFRYKHQNPWSQELWNNLTNTEKHYQEHCYRYKIQMHQGILYYTEYCDGEEIENITFEEPEYGLIIKHTQNQSLNFETLYNKVKSDLELINENKLLQSMSHLLEAGIIYYDIKLDQIISLVHI